MDDHPRAALVSSACSLSPVQGAQLLGRRVPVWSMTRALKAGTASTPGPVAVLAWAMYHPVAS